MGCCNNIYPDLDLRRWEVCNSVQLANAENYYNKQQVDEMLENIAVSGGVTEEEVNELIDDALETINNELSDKLDASALTGYATEQWVENKGYLTEHQSLDNYYTKIETNTYVQDGLSGKQNSLISGQNIKTVNGQSLLGSGNIVIGTGGTVDLSDYYTKTETNGLLDNKLDASAYTPTDLSNYWTSGETQEAINAATSGIPSSSTIEGLRNDLNALSGDVHTNYYSKAEVNALIAALGEQIAALQDCCSSGGSGSTTTGNKWVLHISGQSDASLACDDARDNMHNMLPENEFVHAQYGPFNSSTGYPLVTSAEIGECVVGIMDSAFTGFTNLSSITVTDGLYLIGDSAFNGCTSLTDIPNSSNLEAIGNSAFYSCRSLTSVTIPSGVTRIGGWAFADCTSLSSITMEGTTPPTLGNYAFYNEYGTEQLNITIYVPSSALNTYKQASRWSTYASKIQAIN